MSTPTEQPAAPLPPGPDLQTLSIYAPVASRLAQVEEQLRELCRTDIADLNPLLDYALRSGGKRVRPALTLLAAGFHEHCPRRSLIMASAVELLHLATLIHDDTVDNAGMRRGKPTINRLYGNHVAVLLGDYLFATSATFVCDTGVIRVIRRFSETIMELASGQLIEFFTTFDPAKARHLYNERIYRKTASLFRTSAESGAILSGAPEPQVQALRDYGCHIGMAFQIVDDLLDVQGDATQIGKPVGNDLLQGVLTLPTIMLMERYPKDHPIETLFAAIKTRATAANAAAANAAGSTTAGPGTNIGDGNTALGDGNTGNAGPGYDIGSGNGGSANPRDGSGGNAGPGDAEVNALLSQSLAMINNSAIIPDCFAVIRQYCAQAAAALDALPDCPPRRSLLEMVDYIRERTR